MLFPCRNWFIYQCRNYATRVKCNWESFPFPFIFSNVYYPYCCYLPISGFFASSASSVVKRVFGKRMKIFDLQKADKGICDYLMMNTLIQIAFKVWVICTHLLSLDGPLIYCNYRAVTKLSSLSIVSSPSNNTLPAQFVLFCFVA